MFVNCKKKATKAILLQGNFLFLLYIFFFCRSVTRSHKKHPYGFPAGTRATVRDLLQGASIPSLVILCSDTFPERSASAASIIVLSVSLAALIAPSVMGAIIKTCQHLWAMVLILICLPVSIPLLLLATKKKK